jgi:hypothetical protein
MVCPCKKEMSAARILILMQRVDDSGVVRRCMLKARSRALFLCVSKGGFKEDPCEILHMASSIGRD